MGPGPCPWIYNQVAKKLYRRMRFQKGIFYEWIHFYADDSSTDVIKHYFRMIDTYAE